jgi:hypothetical protein
MARRVDVIHNETSRNFTHDDLKTYLESDTVFQNTLPQDFESVKKWNFEVLGVQRKDQPLYVYHMLKHFNHIERFKVDLKIFAAFLQELFKNYNRNGNPFHNSDHGFSVMHASFYVLITATGAKMFNDLEKFSILLSSLCHDVGHTGRTNMFEINSLSNLAIKYHDRSVLEQYHAALTFKILKSESCNFLQNLPVDEFKSFRKFVIGNILATDLKEHFDMSKKLEEKLKLKEEGKLVLGTRDQLPLLMLHCR